MARRSVLPELDLERIRRYCAGRVPPQFADEIRIEVEVRGRSVTVRECRPPWKPEWVEWSRRPVAQLRYDEASGKWRLFAADRKGHWLAYPRPPARQVERLLDEIEADPTAIFWG